MVQPCIQKEGGGAIYILRVILIVTLLAGCVGDVASTLMCYYKAPLDNETSPLHFGNIYLTMFIKVMLFGFIGMVLWKWYLGLEYALIRYFVIYMVFFACLLQVGAIYNNIQYFLTPSEQLAQASKEQLKQAYTEMVFDAGIINPYQVPVMFLFLPINLLQFIFWRSFEKWRNQSALDRDNYIQLAYA